MSKRERRSRFRLFLLMYALILTAAAGAGLAFLWQFLGVYEASRSEHTVEAFQESLQASWEAELQTYARDNAAEYEDASQVLAALHQALGTEAHRLQRQKQTGDGLLEYRIVQANRPVGTVSFQSASLPSPSFGLTGWQMGEIQWEMPDELRRTISVTAPAGCTVLVNGVALGQGNAHVEVLPAEESSLTRDYGGRERVLYVFSCFSQPEITAAEDPWLRYTCRQAGNAYEITAQCRWERCLTLAGMVEQFVRDYVAYGANAAPYSRVLRHIVADSGLHSRITGSVDGMHWVKGVSSRIHNFSIESFTPWADALICRVSYDLLYVDGTHYPTGMEILLVQQDDSWLVQNIEME